MNQTLTETKLRICPKCRYEADTAETKCPRCGRILLTQTKIRTLGIVILILGIFLAVIMAVVTSNIYPAISQPNASSKFTGTETQAHQILAILGLTFAAGVLFAATGLWQIIFGRRNRLLVWISLLIILAAIVVSAIFVMNVKS